MGTGLVGRKQELATLTAALDAAQGSRGSIVLLGGEPGIGKTRLTRELADVARARAITVRWGRCPDGEGAPPYWPWIQVLWDDPLDGALLPLVGEGAVAADEGARFRLFEAVRAHLSGLDPSLVVLDDLQWADPATLKLLEHVAPSVVDSRLLLVSTYRDVEVTGDHPLRATLAELGRAADARRVDLPRLTDGEIAELALLEAGGDLSSSEVEALASRAEGNPFFAGELVRLAASGRPGEVPAGVGDVVRRRIDALGPRARDVLTDAAVIGRELDLDVLAAIHDDAAAQLAAAARIGIVAEVDVGRWRFSHDLVREALESELAPTARAERHAAVALAIERRHGNDPGWIAPLAHHRIAAATVLDDPAKVIESAIAAGDQAAARHAHEDAARLYAVAVERLQRAGPTDAGARPDTLYGVLTALGRSRFTTADFEGSRVAFLAAAGNAEERGDRVAHAEALLAIGWERWEGPESAAPRVAIDRALAGIGEERPDLRARLLARLAASHQLPPAASEAVARDAIATARAAGDPRALTKAIGTWYFYWSPAIPHGDVPALINELDAAAAQLDDRQVRLDRAAAHFRHLVGLGEIGAAARMRPLLTELEREAGAPPTGSFAMSDPMFATMAGRLDEAEERASELLDAARTPYEQEFLLPVYFGQTAIIRWLQGRLDEMSPLVESLTDARERDTIDALRVLAHVDAGRYSAAGRVAAAISDATLDSMFYAPFGVGFIGLVMLAVAAGITVDRELGGRLAPVLARAEGGLAVAGMPPMLCVGAADTARALLDWLLGRDRDAEERFARAHEILAEVPTFRAHNDFHWARLRAADGDRDAARELAVAANALAHPIGMHVLAEQAAELAARLGSASLPGRAPTGPAPADRTVTLVFTDIVSSTEQAALAGDHAWAEVLRAHYRAVRALVAEHGGREVKTMGDGFMLAFGTTRGAVACARAIQLAMEEAGVAVRVGVHTGETVRDGDDYWGHHVNLAARIGALAGGGEVLVSDVVRAIAGGADFVFGPERTVALKGIPNPVVVCALEWRET